MFIESDCDKVDSLTLELPQQYCTIHLFLVALKHWVVFFFFLCNFHPEEIIERGSLKGFWEEQQCLGMKTLLTLQALGKRDCCLCEADFFLLLLPMFCFGLWLPFCGGNTWKPLSVLDYSMSLEQEQPHDSCRLSLIKSKSCHMNSCLADIPYQHKTIAEKSCIFLLLASDFGH